MEQVSRSINQKINRDRLRKKIKDLTPRQFYLNERYHYLGSQGQQLPHHILSKQYRHFKYPQYNQNGFISKRQIYSYPEMMIYQPLRSNQLEKEHLKSKQLSMGNQFLKNYDPGQYQLLKEQFMKKYKLENGISQGDKADKDQNEKNKNKNKNKKGQQNKSEKLNKEHKNQNQKKTSSGKSVIFPKINQKRTITKRALLRRVFIAVYFIQILKATWRRFILKKKQFNEKFLEKYIVESTYEVKDYYYELLQNQLVAYIQYLQDKNKNPYKNLDKQLMDILVSISTKILKQGIPRVIMKCIMLTCTNYSFFPCPFLSVSEIRRLQFSQTFGCTVDIDFEYSHMIAAMFLVVKLLANYVLYRPWEYYFQYRADQLRDDPPLVFNKLLKYIYEFGSIFYFIALEKFLLTFQEKQRQSEVEFTKMLKQFQVEPILPVVIEEEDEDQQNNTKRSTKKSKFSQRKSMKPQKNNHKSQKGSMKQGHKSFHRSENASMLQGRKTNYTHRSFTQKNEALKSKLESFQPQNIKNRYGDRGTLFYGQTSQFYHRMKSQYSEQMDIITKNLISWVQKVVSLSMKEYERQRVKRVNKLLYEE